MTTYFDYLPVELLHTIFEYLSNCDILWSFVDLSPYLNSVLNNYPWFHLNFQSILKSRFDFICGHFNSKRILSLTLSDHFQTPGQVRLFFTRFDLRRFIHLQSLTLLSITNDDLSFILSDLPKLTNLKRLMTEARSSQPLLLGQILNQFKYLEHLSVSHGDIFDHTVAFPLHNLKVLNAGVCNFLELRRLQLIVPSLVSLKINLQANHQLQLVGNSKIWSSLKRLDLTLNDQTTFHEIQRCLGHFPQLISLTLNLRGLAAHLADGNRWESCSTIIHLRKFHFVIELDDAPIENPDQIFYSFFTPFWREIKQWYVVITTHQIYTITCFDDQVFLSSASPPLSTAPNDRWFYSNVKRIQIGKENSSINLSLFPNLKKLDWSDETVYLSLNSCSRLRHLIFHQSIAPQILHHILTENPQIDHLTLSRIDVRQLLPLKSIHYLQLQDSIKFTNRTEIRELVRVFPLTKQLFIHLNSVKFMCQIINQCHHLENAMFHFSSRTKPISSEWLKENTRLDNETYSFTCRSEPNRFLIWIASTILPTIPLKDKIAETFDLISSQSTDKCLLQ